MLIVFDVVGTLFSPGRLREAFERAGGDERLMRFWFARLLQTAMASSLAGRYAPFASVAESTLRQAADGRIAEPELPGILAALTELDPWEDARPCLTALRERGHRLAALTNSGPEAAEALIDRAGFADFFEAVYSTDRAERCKPHPAPYRMALEDRGVESGEAAMIAAHAWDIVGADAVGMRTVWISRLEGRWPFPGSPPGQTAPDLAGAADAIG